MHDAYDILIKIGLWLFFVFVAAFAAVMIVSIYRSIDSRDNPKCYADTANAVLPAIHSAAISAVRDGDRERHEYWSGIEESIMEKVIQEKCEKK